MFFQILSASPYRAGNDFADKAGKLPQMLQQARILISVREQKAIFASMHDAQAITSRHILHVHRGDCLSLKAFFNGPRACWQGELGSQRPTSPDPLVDLGNVGRYL